MTATRTKRPTFHPLTVSTVDRLCADAVAITFAVPDEFAEDYTFRAGQYLTLRQQVDGREERRSYSICAPVGAAPRIGVRRVDGGLFSERLVDSLRPGDTLEVLPPLGNFTPELSAAGHHAFVAAGSGITPVLSIVDTVLADGESRATLLYGNRRSDTVMFAEDLADLKDRHPDRLQLVHVLSREPRDVELFSGRLDAERLRALFDIVVPASDIDQWWLCGPYGLVQDAEKVLAERGVPTERVHHELFYVDEPPPAPKRADESTVDGATAEVTVLLDGRETTLALPADTPILDAAQRVRADLPFACKGGVCGTCRAKVTSGKVEMRRNYALEQHELDAGFVLTCQGLPVTDAVTVDYDA
ncbi:ring-1,2-phenylacetyl-CoA epoxidase subunit PaaE [Herbihabitans rhizosphaerae]|uniref:3-ketosteroid-9-alpha-monooxygenase, ferredoxin reductase component n=1 Tax=Herbihabitans rhizosphaerae TaxID=1872711 RepID=A0A4Q7L4F4_9PSEU|nr:1,2-phenylacetyl-CoA epoxidase subunit PaaE [Herbihabitans rhizosphaerae]RZS44509.1 ring-1,2-phenylacetyl-CoA epoxidase subunit PaaE [Herbihabitans rhizosphaerae]